MSADERFWVSWAAWVGGWVAMPAPEFGWRVVVGVTLITVSYWLAQSLRRRGMS